ncbi:hypothetical protein FD33_GL000354 [Companilactobacillus paralimentarius DSM 13238 = JCM 10415]|uniref:Uncharacterized protein n=2 Tax=Companilactobacillus paralimentarius TaxID=83526 RepID=A0A0R1PCG4_9LACO|nr:hypothetical protein [Companilactobacillus paralimentarius]KAE9563455.1 hypothetical protein ATN96_10400 [Companilactobacillus paralimentarius]KRL29932.1 hypothetical protein FD33_GL000354 [Companilactobacillus paralimentarius DSM 13238 = JCM 10415]QFR69037.1 hypothetical protein LP238_03790 [Companilactobacillus paralimentarius]
MKGKIMLSSDYFIGFMSIFLFWLLLLLLEIILNMRNTIIELSFFSDEKLSTLDRKLDQRFGARFQGLFEFIEFLIIGYIVYAVLTDLRFQGFQLDASLFGQIIFLSVIVVAVMVGDILLIAKDLHIYKFIKHSVALSRKNSN